MFPSMRGHFGTDYTYIEIEERGTDNTVEVLGIINTFTESECKGPNYFQKLRN